MSRLPALLLVLVACELPPDAGRDARMDTPPATVVQPVDDVVPDPAVNGDDALRDQLLELGFRATPPPPPVSDALYTLGQALVFDPILSGNRDIACLSCHHPDLATSDGEVLSRGVDGTVIARNAPALCNLHALPTMFWDNRVRRAPDGSLVTPAGADLTAEMEATLTYGVVAAQAMFPVVSREEMRGQPGENGLADMSDDDYAGIWAALMDRLRDEPAYVALLEDAYPDEPVETMTFAHAANAIAAFEIEAFASVGSPFERFLAGEDTLTPAQRRGATAFVDGGCARCHVGPGLSDARLHNTGLAQIGPGVGEGPSGLEDRGAGDWRFRTPPLTNTTLTGPWGHAGQYDTLVGFVEHYRNPARELEDYDVLDHLADPTLFTTRFEGADAQIVATLDPLMRGPQPRIDVVAVVDLLEALEDPAARELGEVVPGAVPSGLDVAP